MCPNCERTTFYPVENRDWRAADDTRITANSRRRHGSLLSGLNGVICMGNLMAINHRIFIAFAIEDEWACKYLAGQAKNERSPFAFVDMSVKEPWDERWKTQCRSRIKGCDGAIALISKNTARADGQLWEINCCREERVPILGVYTKSDDRPVSLPTALNGVRVVGWTWDNIANFLGRL